jgi:cell division protease FtsH
MDDLNYAREKIMMGAERKSMLMSEKEKEMTAYHEAGHAIVGWLVPDHDPVYKVTIVPRGQALGLTHYLPEADRLSNSKADLMGRIASAYGGRIAEEMIYGADQVSTGAMSDINAASSIARNMVEHWGFSSLGPISFADSSTGERRPMSAATSKTIDEEVKRFIDEGHQTAETILQENKDKLHAMTQFLIKYETLDAGQIAQIMRGEEPSPPSDWDDENGGGTPSPPVEDKASEEPSDGGSTNLH